MYTLSRVLLAATVSGLGVAGNGDAATRPACRTPALARDAEEPISSAAGAAEAVSEALPEATFLVTYTHDASSQQLGEEEREATVLRSRS